LFSVLDHYLRRGEAQDRVIGALLGTINGSVVLVSNSFAIPHTEKDQVAFINIEVYQTMKNLHSEVSSSEQIVGWYSTSVRESSVLMHEFFWREINVAPLHLVVDPQFLRRGPSFGVQVFYNVPITLDRNCQNQFRPLKHNIKADQADRLALQRLIMEKDQKEHTPLSDLDSLEQQVNDIIEMIDTLSSYVHNVATGKIKGDPKISKLVEQALAVLPLFDSDSIQKIFTKGVQDILMVVFLANLARTQLLLAEKLRDSPKTEPQSLE